MKRSKTLKVIQYTLFFLLAFMALNAFGGGIYGMSGAKGIPLEWLDGTPFHSFFIPSLILFVIVGGSFFVASIAVFIGHRFAVLVSTFSIMVVFIWLGVQLLMIGSVSFLQPATACVSSLILLLTLFYQQQLKKSK